MASFNELIKSKPVKAAYVKRQSVVAELDNTIQAISELDTETPNARTFNRVEVAANGLLEELKVAISELDCLLFSANPDIKSDVDYVSDKKLVRECQFKLYNAMDSYTDLMGVKGIQYPPDKAHVAAPDPGDLANVLAQLVKCQTDATTAATAQQIANASQHKETIDTLTKHGTAGPRATQPYFVPKNNESDFLSYRDFIQRFEFFALKFTDAVKLQWLQSSVKGDAAPLVKHLSLSDGNYAVAKGKLENKYNNPDSIKHTLLQSILSFKCETNPKFTKCQASVTGFNNALVELKTIHEVDSGDKFQEEILC